MFWYLGNQAPVDRCNHHPRLMNGGCCILINPTALAVDEGCRGRDHLTRTLGKGGLKGRGDFYEMPRYLMTLVDKVIEFHQSKQNQSTGQRRHLLCPEKKNLTTQGLRRTRCARGLPRDHAMASARPGAGAPAARPPRSAVARLRAGARTSTSGATAAPSLRSCAPRCATWRGACSSSATTTTWRTPSPRTSSTPSTAAAAGLTAGTLQI